MERVEGRKLTDPEAVSFWRRPGLFHSTVRALLADVLFSRDETVLFHGDPHAGNLLATPEGCLAVLDWSLAGQLTTDDRVHLVQILVGGWARDPARITDAALGLAAPGAGKELIGRHVAVALRERPWYRPPGPVWAIDLLDTLVRAGVRFPPRLLLFRKAFLSLGDVLAEVCPLGSLDLTLLAEALRHLVWEWPLRWWQPLADRDWASHVSSADLQQLLLRGFAPLGLGHLFSPLMETMRLDGPLC
jgi:ubiquinone biosynthesis protein